MNTPTDKDLEGVGALVTGGGSGIGLGCARRLAREGAVVTVCGRRENVLRDAVTEIGNAARYVVCDVTIPDQVDAAVAAAAEAPRGLGVLVANAGGSTASGPLVLTDLAAWNQTLALNITGTLLCINNAAPLMARAGGGSVIAVSSIAGGLTHRNLGAYSIAKAAVEALVRNAADELGRFGVRVNAVRPGLVPTEMADPLVQDEYTRVDYLAQMPLGRLGTVDDIAAAVRFLAGSDAAWITGQVFAVDGGHTLRRGPDLDHLLGRHFESALIDVMGVEPGKKE